MFSDADSLPRCQMVLVNVVCLLIPAIVVIAIDVQHFHALDTENTILRLGLITTWSSERTCPERTHSVKPN